jgi:hypothetical protein
MHQSLIDLQLIVQKAGLEFIHPQVALHGPDVGHSLLIVLAGCLATLPSLLDTPQPMMSPIGQGR